MYDTYIWIVLKFWNYAPFRRGMYEKVLEETNHSLGESTKIDKKLRNFYKHFKSL